MATRALGAMATVAVLVAATTVAIAQTRARPSHGGAKPKPTASATSEPPPDDKSAATSNPVPPASSPDAGAIPAPDDLSGGSRLSPLNPTASEFSDAGPPASSIDYDRLLAEISSLRARVAAVSDTLFHSRIAISVETSGDHGRIAALTVSLDDGVVWTSPTAFRAEDATTVYDHAVAPGHHAVTVDV